MTRLFSRHASTLSVFALSAIIVALSLPALGQDATDATDPWQMVIMASSGSNMDMVAIPRPYSTKKACLDAADHLSRPGDTETFRHNRTMMCSSLHTGETITITKN